MRTERWNRAKFRAGSVLVSPAARREDACGTEGGVCPQPGSPTPRREAGRQRPARNTVVHPHGQNRGEPVGEAWEPADLSPCLLSAGRGSERRPQDWSPGGQTAGPAGSTLQPRWVPAGSETVCDASFTPGCLFGTNTLEPSRRRSTGSHASSSRGSRVCVSSSQPGCEPRGLLHSPLPPPASSSILLEPLRVPG